MSLNPRGGGTVSGPSLGATVRGRVIEPNQLPGLALLDANATAVRLHPGSALGDYPPVVEVVEELRRIAGS